MSLGVRPLVVYNQNTVGEKAIFYLYMQK